MPTAETLTVLQVAVPTPVNATIDYLPPHGIDARDLHAGVRHRVPFGRTQATGIVMAINKASRIDPRRLRPAIAALDPAPVIGRDLLALGQWAAHYYPHPIGEVFAPLLPALLRHGKPSTEVADRYWRLTAAGGAQDGSRSRWHRARRRSRRAGPRAGAGERAHAAMGCARRRTAPPSNGGDALGVDRPSTPARVERGGGGRGQGDHRHALGSVHTPAPARAHHHRRGTRPLLQAAGRLSQSRARHRGVARQSIVHPHRARLGHALARDAVQRRTRALPDALVAATRRRCATTHAAHRRRAAPIAGRQSLRDIIAEHGTAPGARPAGALVPESPRLCADAALSRLRLGRALPALRCAFDLSRRAATPALPPLRRRAKGGGALPSLSQ